ncbi:hypothetical protein VZO05_10190 [Aggregatilineales bacterium SYSU G02658]
MSVRHLTLLMGALLLAALAHAQSYTEDDAIALALTLPECRDTIDHQEGWYALAYDTQNAYGIWRVEFYDSAGEDMGYAHVSPRDGRVYDGYCLYRPSDAQIEAARPTLEAFVRSHEEILALIPYVDELTIYVDYDVWNDWWGVYIANEENSLYVTVKFAEATPLSLDDPELTGIYFPEVKHYEEWFNESAQQAIIVAFIDRRIGDRLANLNGWTTETEHLGQQRWRVDFWLEANWLASAVVDLTERVVVEVSVS